MSWDVIVFNYNGKPPTDMDDMAEDNPAPLGKAAAVRKSISKSLESVDWSNPKAGIYEGDGFSIEFDLGESDVVESMMLSIRGSGQALSALLQFAKPNNWSLFDCSTSEFIDLDNPSGAGWEGFQEYRDKVIKKTKMAKKAKRKKS